MFVRGVYIQKAATLAEPMPMQIAQDKRNADRFPTYIVRETHKSIL